MLLDQFDILNRIYEGRRSVIYRAIQKKDKRKVILKTPASPHPGQETLALLRHEFETMKHLEGGPLPQAYELIQTAESSCLVMADEGLISLRELMAGRGPMEPKKLLELALSMVTALDYLHEHQVIHKDVNPSNLCLLPATGEVRVIDFEISTNLGQEQQGITDLKSLKGTLPYVSPEQTGRMNRVLDYRTDYYSLGVTLFELATGKLPCDSTDVVELVHFHIARQPPDPTEFNPALPKQMAAIFLKLMEKTAENRYQSGYGLKADLERCLTQLEQTGKIQPFTLGIKDFSPKLSIPQKLYGRTKEVDQIIASFNRVARGDKELVLVKGTSGVGKTAVIHEVHKPITEKNGYFIEGKFDQIKKSVPYSSIIQAFKELVRQTLSFSQEEILYWRLKLNEVLGKNGQVIIDVIPEVELIIGPQPELEELPPVEAHNRFFMVMLNFISCFASEENPLVLFFDDLQWAGKGTLEFIERLMLHDESGHILLIGAYRDDDLDQNTYLVHAIRRFSEAKINLRQLTLENLPIEEVELMLQDTLGSGFKDIEKFAELCLKKTAGNPFFLSQFLMTLYQEGLLLFQPERGEWIYDIMGIQQKESTGNVLDLMIRKLNQLGPSTLEVLKLAAAFGNFFSLMSLAEVRGQSPMQTAEHLEEALKGGLILPMDDKYKLLDENTDFEKVEFRFLHDRVGQAAYMMLSDAQKKGLHLKIARILTAKYGVSNEKVYDVMAHYNMGRDLIEDPIELDDLVMYNFLAGKKAMYSVAFDHALQYFESAIEMIPEKMWAEDYEFAFGLHLDAAEAAYLVQQQKKMDQWVSLCRQKAKADLDQIKIYEVVIPSLIMRNRLVEAIDEGLAALRVLGVRLPENPSKARVAAEFVKFKATMMGKDLDEISHSPPMKEADHLAIMRIMGLIGFVSYYVRPNLLGLLVFRGVSMTIKFGNSPLSSFFMAGLSFLLVGPLRNIELGYQVAQVAEGLLKRSGSNKLECRVLMVTSGLVSGWRKHYRDVIYALEYAHQSGVQNGDFEYAAVAVPATIGYYFFSGMPLYEYHGRAQALSPSVLRYRDSSYYHWYLLYAQLVDNLIGVARDPAIFEGQYFKVSRDLSRLSEANDQTGFCIYFHFKCMLNYLFHHFEQAVEYADKAETVIESQMATVVDASHNYFDSLSRLALFAQSDSATRKATLKKVAQNQKVAQKWIQACSANHKHCWYLVEAERLKAEGQLEKAQDHFDRAVQEALNNDYVQWVALASERAGIHYLEQGLTKLAHYYLTEAFYHYQQWGAVAKCKQMEARFKEIINFSGEGGENTLALSVQTTSSVGTSVESLDMSSMVKASQALSKEIHIDRLIKRLMLILIENAGATRGVFAMADKGEVQVHAEAVAEGRVVELIEPINVECYPHLPMSMVNQARRLMEPILVEDLEKDPQIKKDPYFHSRRVLSMICLPILGHGEMVGLIYLENNLQANSLTSERVETLQILAGQAAISLQNAKLYHTLEQKVAERTSALNQSLEEVNQANRNIMDSMEYAKLIQESLLPKEGVLSQAIKESFLIWKPREIVGGDLYFCERHGDKLMVALMDCTGHGVPGALMTMIVASGFRRVVNEESCMEPAEVLRRLDASVKVALRREKEAISDDGLDAAILVLDLKKKTLSFAGAHLPLLLFDQGELQVFKGDRVSIGYSNSPKEYDFTLHEMPIKKGMRLYLMTDGMQDQIGKSGYPLGRKKLREWLVRLQELSMASQKPLLLQEFETFKGEESVRDDITVIGLDLGSLL